MLTILCLQQEATSSLKLPNVAGIFYLLLCGIIIGVSMGLTEFFYKTSVEARHRKVCVGHLLFPQSHSAGARPGRFEQCCGHWPATVDKF